VLEAEPVGHGTSVAAKRRPAIDRGIIYLGSHRQSDEWQVEHCGGQHGGVTVVAAGQASHEMG